MGMKTAALSMGPILEVYSWQEPKAYYSMILDVEEVGKSRSNLVELPEPTFCGLLPDDIVSILTKPMAYPKDKASQELIADSSETCQSRPGFRVFYLHRPHPEKDA